MDGSGPAWYPPEKAHFGPKYGQTRAVVGTARPLGNEQLLHYDDNTPRFAEG